MPGNPLTDPNWASDLADTVERLVQNVRTKATTPAIHAARAVVYGLLAGLLGVTAVVLVLIAGTRALQALLDLAVSWERAVYLSYLIIGGILCVAAVLFFRKRHSPEN